MKRIQTLIIAIFLPVLTYGALPEKSPTPSLGPLPSNQVDFVIDLEYLLWYANISETYYAIKKEFILTNNQVAPNNSVLTPRKKEELDWSWDSGSRVGLGIVTNHDGWDLYSTWTYLFNSANDSTFVPQFDSDTFNDSDDNPIGTQTLSSPWFLDPDGEDYNHISAKITLLYNQVDLELRRAFWLGKFLSARPFFGARGFWTTVNYYVKGSRPAGANITFLTENTQNRQKRWGVGLLGGLNTAWHMSSNWSLFGNGSVALTYGKVTQRKKMSFLEVDDTNLLVARIRSTLTDNYYDIQPILDLSAGIRFETVFNQTCRVLIDAGYEFHYLHDFNKLISGIHSRQNNELATYPPSEGDLTLSGFVARFRLDF